MGSRFTLSVEIEPPAGSLSFIMDPDRFIEMELRNYVDHVDLLSITNRSVWRISSMTMAKKVQKISQKIFKKRVDTILHLTTRTSMFDTYKHVLDAHQIGIKSLLPILGDPRGPKIPGYFRDGFEILSFVAYLTQGRVEFLTSDLKKLWEKGEFPEPLPHAKFSVGSVIDPNPHKFLHDKKIEIRTRQLQSAVKKKQHGAEFFLSQAIYNPDYYFEFIDNLDIEIPIAAGILPARLRLIKLFGLPCPGEYRQRLKMQPSVKEEVMEGNRIAAEIFLDLKERGCKWIHIYTIGNSKNFKAITDINSSPKVIAPKLTTKNEGNKINA